MWGNKKKSVSQGNVARKVGLSPPTVEKAPLGEAGLFVEKGVPTHKVSPQAARVSSPFGLSIHWLSCPNFTLHLAPRQFRIIFLFSRSRP